MSSFVHRSLIGAAAAAILAGSAGAQLLPGVGLPALPPVNLPTRNVPVIGPTLQDILAQPGAREAVSPTLNTVSGLPERIAEAPAATLLELRQFRLRELMRQHPRELDNDGNGQPVRRGVLVAVDPDQPSLQLAARAGFAIVADDRDPALGIRSVTLSVPRNLSTRQALRRLRSVAPRLQADFDHVYEPAGGDLFPFVGALAASQGSRGGPRIGIVDGGVASHPSMSGAAIEQNGFAGRPQPTGHGTAVASLIVGNQGPFQGAARECIPLRRRRLWWIARRRIGQLNRPGLELAGLEAPASGQHQPRRSAKPDRPSRGAGAPRARDRDRSGRRERRARRASAISRLLSRGDRGHRR